MEEHVYLLSGPAPISIRDQMLRGVMVVRRLVRYGIINATDCPLLVVGAGAAGATAAITAVEQNVPTLLIESHKSAFLAQAWARTRFIDPTQYDWPLDHWHHGRFPWGPSLRIPLDFKTDTGANLSVVWTAILRHYETNPGTLLEVSYNDRVANRVVSPAGQPPLTITLESGGSYQFGAMILATGFGQENCTVAVKRPAGSGPDTVLYEGQPFWGPDLLTELRKGPISQPSVLISGSGDGALQDYLRVTTGRDLASTLCNECLIPSEIIPELQSAEDRAQRGRCWANDKTDEAPYLAETQSIFDRAVRFAIASAPVYYALSNILPDFLPVKLVYPEQILTSWYGLNRFLVLLVAAFIKDRFKEETLFPETRISDIAAVNAGHQCLQTGPSGPRAEGLYSPDNMLLSHTCFGEPHQVKLERGDGSVRMETFNVIVVRHGFRTPPATLPSRPRHLLPYHLPI